MKLFISVVLVSLLACSCHSSRLAADSGPNNAATHEAPAVSKATPQLTDKAPTLNPNQTEVSRPGDPDAGEVSHSLLNAETK